MQITAKNDAIKIDPSANTDDTTNIIYSIGRESFDLPAAVHPTRYPAEVKRKSPCVHK